MGGSYSIVKPLKFEFTTNVTHSILSVSAFKLLNSCVFTKTSYLEMENDCLG